MRLNEFDNLDETAFKSKFGIDINDMQIQFSKRFLKISEDYKLLSLSIKGREMIESLIGKLLDDIESVYDFCNNCNDDNETRLYLDNLISMNKKLVKLLDEVQK